MTAGPALGREVGLVVCEKLGLDPSVVKDITIRIDPSGLVEVDITIFDTQEVVADLILPYNLVPAK